MRNKYKEFYDLEIKEANGTVLSMSDYEDKPILIVNTATECGLSPQFDGLEELHNKYKDSGLVVIGCPCNQFGGQEPVEDDKMTQTCKVRFGVTFPLTEKIDVNGTGTHPVFRNLKNQSGNIFMRSIKWNFTKFLVDKNGKLYKRYGPLIPPSKIEKDIEDLL